MEAKSDKGPGASAPPPAESRRARPRDVLFFSSGGAFQPYRYSVGRAGTRFFTELKERRRFFGQRCGKCRRVYVPPRPVCGPCFEPLSEWVEVGPPGTLSAFTILRFAFIDPETGKTKPVPYVYAFIRLDGADTCFQHFMRYDAQRPPKIGMRLAPVFEEIRTGTLRDVRHFEAAS